MDPTSGLISGTIARTADASSPYTVTLTATDGTNTASQTFTWTVTHVFIVNPGDQQNAAGDGVALQINAGDRDGDPVTYGAAGLPPGLSINSAGAIVGTISSSAVSANPYSVTVFAGDGSHWASQTFQWTVGRLLVADPGVRTNYDGDVVSLQIAATDHNAEPVTFAAGGLPPGLNINPATGLISGTIAAAADSGGPYTTTVTATGGGASSSQTFTWVVNNPIPRSDPEEQDVIQSSAVDVHLGGNDAKGGTLAYSAIGLPSGLTINQATGEITGAIATVGRYASKILVSDGTFSNSLAFTWDVLVLGGVALAGPAQSASMITAQADLFSEAFGAYAAPLRFQLANASVNGGYMIVHVHFDQYIDAPKAVLAAQQLDRSLQSDFYVALPVSAGKTTPDAPKQLYDPNNVVQAKRAGDIHWDVMTNAAKQQLKSLTPPPTADLWAHLPWLDTKSSGEVAIEGDVFFLEGATQDALVKKGLFKTAKVPGLDGEFLTRLATGFSAVQDDLVKMFNGTPDSPFRIQASWNADTNGGDTQVKIVQP